MRTFTMNSMIEPFRFDYSSSAWEDLVLRLKQTRWYPAVHNESPVGGVDQLQLQEVCDYWSTHFDWQSQLALLSELPHYSCKTAEGQIHILHVRGKGAHPIPLILTHGWPGSFLEFIKMIPLLTNPAAYGIHSDITFDVVIPSLPGFGFSDPPRHPGMNVFKVAEVWVEVMTALGYERFAAHGGDLGAGVTTALGLRHQKNLLGIHLNYIPGSYRPCLAAGPVLSAEEEAFLSEAATWYDQNGAYAHLQSTRPKTVAYGLNDSPAGLAAWMIEKFWEWSDRGSDANQFVSKDELLTNITLYWMTQTITSSLVMYQEGRKCPLHFRENERVRTPCAVAHFPKEILMPPRSWVERGYDVRRWTKMATGGHFAALEQPRALATDLHQFFSEL